jgi:arylsulfatase A-like enzyme
MARRFLILGMSAALVVGSCSVDRTRTPIRRVILIMVDTLRADAVGFAGGPVATPAMDRLAADGVVFSQARSHIPITGPSHATLFTALSPPAHGVTNNRQILAAEFTTMAELLRDQGWQTAGVVSLGVMGARYGLGQGFDHYVDDTGENWWLDAAEVNRRVRTILDEDVNPEAPAFLFVHYSDPHEPYAPPDRDYPTVRARVGDEVVGEFAANGRRTSIIVPIEVGRATVSFEVGSRPLGDGDLLTLKTCRTDPKGGIRHGRGMFPFDPNRVGGFFVTQLPGDLVMTPKSSVESVELSFVPDLKRPEEAMRADYHDEVRFVDQAIGELMNDLGARGLLDDAVVVFVSDHGEGLGDHGLPGHVEQLYDTLLGVPLVIHALGRLAPEVRTDRVGLEDLLPTLCGLLGVAPPKGSGGRDLFGPDGQVETPLLAWTFRPQASRDLRAVVHEGFKLIEAVDGAAELYDLTMDPDELLDLAGDDPERVRAMRGLFGEAAAIRGEAPPLVDAEREMLEALGYAVGEGE